MYSVMGVWGSWNIYCSICGYLCVCKWVGVYVRFCYVHMYERGWVQMVCAYICTTLKKGQGSEGCHTMINEENGKLIGKVEEEIVMSQKFQNTPKFTC